eukprot:CAMPEP_0198425368 /NCGR_PEP_ID=MMETSP1452-20131203/4521_1 /TAXON_ID=1181717 /ORGANISM="Synchroma pusillum, Strain CCMP3072" /LENGTH=306 /DNA_ID=CAMNT_0044145723 /DNA_START=42 /DNA_END=959 /DNA_ORIENTATION=-
MWKEFRYMHAHDVSEVVEWQLRELEGTAAAELEKRGAREIEMNRMSQGVREMAAYRSKKVQLGQAAEVVQQMFLELRRRNLVSVSEVQMTVCTNMGHDGRRVPADKLVRMIHAGLQACPDVRDRYRLLGTVVVSQPALFTGATRHELLAAASLPLEAQHGLLALSSLRAEAADMDSDADRAVGQGDEEMWRRNARGAEDLQGVVERHQPIAAVRAEQLARGVLDEVAYPYVVQPPPNVPIEAPSSMQRMPPSLVTGPPTERREGPRYIVFMVGGVCHRDIAACHRVSDALGVEVVLATTDVYNPSG